MTQTIQERPALLAKFAQRQTRLAGAGPEWLQTMRRRALGRFEELGFPTSRMEEWKNTNVAPIARTAFVPAPDARDAVDAGRLVETGLDALAARRLVFVNGRLSETLSSIEGLPDGVIASNLAQALAETPAEIEARLGSLAGWNERAFLALNAALFEDGAFVLVPAGVTVEEPIHVVHLTAANGEPAASFSRTLAIVGDRSRVTVIESYAAVGAGPTRLLSNR